MTDEPDVVIEEYEEVVENLDELSDRVESEDAETESIQEPTSINRRILKILTTHTGRPSLRSTNARLAGRQEESKPVVVTPVTNGKASLNFTICCLSQFKEDTGEPAVSAQETNPIDQWLNQDLNAGPAAVQTSL